MTIVYIHKLNTLNKAIELNKGNISLVGVGVGIP
jgi:hypothetical protein